MIALRAGLLTLLSLRCEASPVSSGNSRRRSRPDRARQAATDHGEDSSGRGAFRAIGVAYILNIPRAERIGATEYDHFTAALAGP